RLLGLPRYRISSCGTLHLTDDDPRRGISLLARPPVPGAGDCPGYFRGCETGCALSPSLRSRSVGFEVCRLVVFIAPFALRAHYRGGTTARRFAAVWRSGRH